MGWNRDLVHYSIHFCLTNALTALPSERSLWIVWFLWIFMYPGSWKLKKIKASYFWGFSCTRGRESWRKWKCLIFVDFHVPGGHETWTKLNRLIFVDFMYPGSWKLKKIKASNFCGFPCNRGTFFLNNGNSIIFSNQQNQFVLNFLHFSPSIYQQ